MKKYYKLLSSIKKYSNFIIKKIFSIDSKCLYFLLLPILVDISFNNHNINFTELYFFVRNNRLKIINISSTGSLVFSNREYVYKISLNENAYSKLVKEVNAWNFLKQTHINNNVVSSMDLVSGSISYLKMPYYLNIKEYNTPKYAQWILSLLAKYGIKNKCHINDNMKIALNLVEKCRIYSLKELETINCLLQKWEKNNCSYGYIHGDLHLRNILESKNTPIMIDLDKFSTDGIQEFDNIYISSIIFNVHKTWKENILKININDLVYKTNNITDDNLIEYKLAFILDKLGENNSLNKNYLDVYNIKGVIQEIINES